MFNLITGSPAYGRNRIVQPSVSVSDLGSSDTPIYPIDSNPPKPPLVDLMAGGPIFASDINPSKDGGPSVTVPLGPANNDVGVPLHVIDPTAQDAPLYPIDYTPQSSSLTVPTVTNPSPASPAPLTVAGTPSSDPVAQITTLLDLFESRFAGSPAGVATTANPNAQGGYIIIPDSSGASAASAATNSTLIWLAVLGIAVTIGFYLYERRKK